MLDLAGLPLDVRVPIISFISSKYELLSISYSCSSPYAAAISRLYRRLSVSEEIDTEVLTAALRPENAGLQHVRHLEIMAEGGEYSKQRPLLERVVSMLAYLLPRDILLTFVIDCSTSFSWRTMQTLYRRQRFLRTTRIDDVLDVDAVLNGSTTLRFITFVQLQVHACITAATGTGYELLRRLPALQHLEVRASFKYYCADTTSYRDPTRDRASAEIIKTIPGFGLIRDATPFELSSLSLYDLDLTSAARGILHTVNCSRLHSLVLQRCENIVALLRGIRPI